MYQQEPLDSSLIQPHFDEEATLVSARPVVPLSVVHARGRRRNVLWFGGAIALSIFVGAFGATLLYSQRHSQTPPAAQSSEPTYSALTTSVSGGIAAASPDAVSTADSAESQSVNPIDDDQLLQSSTASESRTVRTNRAQLVKKPVAVAASSSAINERTIKAVRANNARQQGNDAPIEERRPRRVEENQTQIDKNNSSDLFRIREIFEGSRSERRHRNQRPTPY